MVWDTNKTLDEITSRITDDDDKILTNITDGRVEPDVKDLRIGEARNFELSVIHVDIVNFTNIIGNLTPIEKLRFLNTFQTEITHIVHDYDGTVEKYTGDRVTCLFGIGNPNRRSAQNCIDAALTMKTEVEHCITPFLIQNNLPKFEVRIGIDFGNVMFARTGIHSDNQFTLVGNAVSIASKLQEHADAKEIILSGGFYSLLSDTEKSYCYKVDPPKKWNWVFSDTQKEYTVYRYMAHWTSHPLKGNK